MKRNILIGASIAILLIALAVTIVSNGTYSTNTISISCGEVSDTTMYVGNTKKITVTIKDTDNNDIKVERKFIEADREKEEKEYC